MTRQEFMAKMAYHLTRHRFAHPRLYGFDTYEGIVEAIIEVADGARPHPLSDALVVDAGSMANLQNHAEDFRDNLGVVGFILSHLGDLDYETVNRIVEG